MKKKLLLGLLFSLVFMGILLSRVEWEHFSSIAGRLDLLYLSYACLLYLGANFIRALRFNRLDHTNSGILHWWNINAFYNVTTSTLPGGAGEAASAYVLKRCSRLGLLSAFRILLLGRLMDLFALSSLFFTAALLVRGYTPYREAAIWAAGVLFVISTLTLLSSGERLLLRIARKLPAESRLMQRILEKLTELINVAEEQRASNSFGITLLQSMFMMIINVLSIQFALRAFGVDFNTPQIFYCYGVYAVFQVVPVQGIAGIGTQAAWWALALNAAGYTAPDAVEMGFVLYGLYYVFVILMALASLVLWGRAKGLA